MRDSCYVNEWATDRVSKKRQHEGNAQIRHCEVLQQQLRKAWSETLKGWKLRDVQHIKLVPHLYANGSRQRMRETVMVETGNDRNEGVRRT